MTKPTRSVFPWHGSKIRLLDTLTPYIQMWAESPNAGKWIEPFLGSGVVSKHVRNLYPNIPMVVGDSNPWLMAAHRYWMGGAVDKPTEKDTSPEQIRLYREMKDSDLPAISDRDKALRFLVCLHTAYGNRWATKPDGAFATPCWPPTKGENSRGGPLYAFRKLQESWGTGWFNPMDQLLTNSWKDTVEKAQPGDLVFLDSPYPELAGYGSVSWDLEDWSEMYLWVEKALTEGISVLVCNPGTLKLLWRRLLPHEKLYSIDPKGDLSTSRTEYIGYAGPWKKPTSLIEELFGQ